MLRRHRVALCLLLLVATLATAANALSGSNLDVSADTLLGYLADNNRENPIGSGAAGVMYQNQAYIIGGSLDSGDSPLKIDGIKFRTTLQFNTTALRWSKKADMTLEADVNTPVGHPFSDESYRAFHTAVVYDDEIWVYGGTGLGNHIVENFWVYNIASDQWRHFHRQHGLCAGPRTGHSSVVIGDSMIMFGGYSRVSGEPHVHNDTWVFDFLTKSWEKKHTTGESPPGLALHAAVAYGNLMFVIGGTHSTAERLVNADAESHVYVLNTDTWHWTLIIPSLGIFPAQFGHSASIVGTSLYFYGGLTNSGVQRADPTPNNALYKYDIDTNTVMELVPDVDSDPFPNEAFFVGLENDFKLYLFGGENPDAAFGWNQRVFVIDLLAPSFTMQPVCSYGWTGPTCSQAECRNDCNGLGVCVAPDVCKCEAGFQGFDCSEHACTDVFGYDLLSLNKEVFYPRSNEVASKSLSQLEDALNYLGDNLPEWKTKCFDEYDEVTNRYTPVLTEVARQAWEFRGQKLLPLLEATKALLRKLVHPEPTQAPTQAPTAKPTSKWCAHCQGGKPGP